MKVKNMTSTRTGKPVANQFIIEGSYFAPSVTSVYRTGCMFQSYDSNIVFIPDDLKAFRVLLDATYWDYSVTTGKYRNQFLGETKKETQAKVDSGEYLLVDLNQ